MIYLVPLRRIWTCKRPMDGQSNTNDDCIYRRIRINRLARAIFGSQNLNEIRDGNEVFSAGGPMQAKKENI